MQRAFHHLDFDHYAIFDPPTLFIRSLVNEPWGIYVLETGNTKANEEETSCALKLSLPG